MVHHPLTNHRKESRMSSYMPQAEQTWQFDKAEQGRLGKDGKGEEIMTKQLTLGQLIKHLELVIKRRPEAANNQVVYDFEYAYPVSLGSWRGSPDMIAIGFSFAVHSIPGFVQHYNQKNEPFNVASFIGLLKDAVGKTFYGWKGGQGTMKESTPLWVANTGNGGSTIVVGILDTETNIVLLTQYHEYSG